ncbi:hypothetical protein HF325_000135 [Metschnikowia pulcherrima]|uniref:Uncharacterized protein n=1 Tax=Metschnikowia pulcherrima TaxID=27326 RepID=A0A8H7LEB5_9ASCO|nr:hypothetical protein HF325_000135 [Metschnikowia pulcherrima]
MADDKSKLNLPRLRVSSHTFNDTSYNSLPNVSQRTVSSSTLLLSTPSNNIRRVQQQMNHARPSFAVSKQKPAELRVSGVSSTAATTRKLLNLQQLRRAPSNPQPFVLRKPTALANYDYSVFASSQDDDFSGSATTLVKDSQIKAWESAEKVSADIIFDDDSLEDPADHLEDDLGEANETVFADTKSEPKVDDGERPCLLTSIPHYTKGELKVIIQNFEKLRTCTSPPNYYDVEDTERKELWLYQQQQNVTQERAFTTNHTLLGKRKVQVFHKKEFLHKLFGYSNNINLECITNNTSYSACDNSFSAQKAFHEDKEEILGLLAEDKAFEEELKVAKENFTALTSKANDTTGCEKRYFDQPMDNLDLLDMTNSWLTSSYEKQTGSYGSEGSDAEPDDHPEVLAYTIGLLKQRVKEAYDDPAESRGF